MPEGSGLHGPFLLPGWPGHPPQGAPAPRHPHLLGCATVAAGGLQLCLHCASGTQAGNWEGWPLLAQSLCLHWVGGQLGPLWDAGLSLNPRCGAPLIEPGDLSGQKSPPPRSAQQPWTARETSPPPTLVGGEVGSSSQSSPQWNWSPLRAPVGPQPPRNLRMGPHTWLGRSWRRISPDHLSCFPSEWPPEAGGAA